MQELEEAANNRYYDWLETKEEAPDAEVANILAGVLTEQAPQDDPAVWSPLSLSSPSHLYQSPLSPADEEINKYDVESEWMDSESENETGQSPSPFVSSPSAFRPVARPQVMYVTGPATSNPSSPLSHVEGQPSCDGQVPHALLGKHVEGHSHCDAEQDLCDHPHPQKYARSVAPLVATFEFTDVRSHEPHVFDHTPTPARLQCANPISRNERVPRQPQPVTPFRSEACAPDSRGYANVVRKPSISVPITPSTSVAPTWVWEPAGKPKILALMSLTLEKPTRNTQFGNRSTQENYMCLLQNAREQG